MAKKEQKMISVEKMDEIMHERFPVATEIDYYGQKLIVRHLVPFDTFRDIVRSVIGACFNTENGDYAPENMDFAFRLCVVEAYSNVRLPQDIEKQYEMLYRTDLFNYVMNEINDDQWEELQSCISDGIDVKNDANRALFEYGVHTVTDQIAQVGMNLQDLLGNVSADDIQKLIGALGEHGVDEGKLVQAVVAEQNKLREAQADGE